MIKKTDNLVSTHYEYLVKTGSVIICDFNSNGFWIKSKLMDLIKAPGFGRTEQFKVKAIYTTQKNRYKDLSINSENIILDANLNTADALKLFIQKKK